MIQQPIVQDRALRFPRHGVLEQRRRVHFGHLLKMGCHQRATSQGDLASSFLIPDLDDAT